MKLPALQFYVGDWRKDPGVQALSYHDRGVWFEMLCLLHESEDRGRLLLNGQPMPDDALARLLGLDKQVLTNTLTNLLTYGVASRDPETGALICRRMVRDEEIRKIRQNCGKLGGNPRLLNQSSKQKSTTKDNQKSTPSSSSSISSSEREKGSAHAPPKPSAVGKPDAKRDLEPFKPLQTPEFEAAWAEWLAYKAARRETDPCEQYLPNTRRVNLEMLARQGVARAVALVRFSLSRGSKGLIFEPKPEELAAFLPGGAEPSKAKRGLSPEEQRQVLLSRRQKAGQS